MPNEDVANHIDPGAGERYGRICYHTGSQEAPTCKSTSEFKETNVIDNVAAKLEDRLKGA